MLRSLGVLVYSPPLEHAITSLKQIPSGHSWEIQIRGCSIWYELRLSYIAVAMLCIIGQELTLQKGRRAHPS